MKRKFLLGSIVMAIALVTAWKVYFASQTDGMSVFSLANVEALARSEIGELFI